MYLSARGIVLRNVSAAILNGAITLVLLLIAPLGIVAVITNTIAVTIATFLVCTGMDVVVNWLIAPHATRKSFGSQMGANLGLWEQKNTDLNYRDRQ